RLRGSTPEVLDAPLHLIHARPSRGRLRPCRALPAEAISLAVVRQVVVEATAEDQQARVLTGVERIGHARAGPPAEAIRLVVVARALPVARAKGASRVVLLLKAHVRRDTPF